MLHFEEELNYAHNQTDGECVELHDVVPGRLCRIVAVEMETPTHRPNELTRQAQECISRVVVRSKDRGTFLYLDGSLAFFTRYRWVKIKELGVGTRVLLTQLRKPDVQDDSGS